MADEKKSAGIADAKKSLCAEDAEKIQKKAQMLKDRLGKIKRVSELARSFRSDVLNVLRGNDVFEVTKGCQPPRKR